MEQRDTTILVSIAHQTLTDEGRGPAYHFIGSCIIEAMAQMDDDADIPMIMEVISMQVEACRPYLIRVGISDQDISAALEHVIEMMTSDEEAT